jgi:hypothetical protein
MQRPRSPCPVSWKSKQASHPGTSATLPCVTSASPRRQSAHSSRTSKPIEEIGSRSIPIHNRPSIVAALTGPGAHRRSSSPPVRRPQGSSITYYTFTGAVGQRQPSLLSYKQPGRSGTRDAARCRLLCRIVSCPLADPTTRPLGKH